MILLMWYPHSLLASVDNGCRWSFYTFLSFEYCMKDGNIHTCQLKHDTGTIQFLKDWAITGSLMIGIIVMSQRSSFKIVLMQYIAEIIIINAA